MAALLSKGAHEISPWRACFAVKGQFQVKHDIDGVAWTKLHASSRLITDEKYHVLFLKVQEYGSYSFLSTPVSCNT